MSFLVYFKMPYVIYTKYHQMLGLTHWRGFGSKQS